MGVLLRILIAVFLVIVGLASQSPTTPPPPDDASSRIFTIIESVTANVLSTPRRPSSWRFRAISRMAATFR